MSFNPLAFQYAGEAASQQPPATPAPAPQGNGGVFNNILQTVQSGLNVAGALLTNKGNASPGNNNAPPPATKPDYSMYIIAGVGVLILVIGVFLFTRKKS